MATVGSRTAERLVVTSRLIAARMPRESGRDEQVAIAVV
jgi:hypothetical protein